MESKVLSPKKVGQVTPNKEEWGSIQEDGKKTKHERVIWSEVWCRQKGKVSNEFYWFGIKSDGDAQGRQVGGVRNGEINLSSYVAININFLG